MRRVLVPLLALLLTSGVPTAVHADEPPPEPAPLPTTTALTTWTPAPDSNTVSLTATVTAEGAVPEGDVELTDGGTTLATVTLESGTATWTAKMATGYHTFVATYVPLDERWEPSASAPVSLFAGDHCPAFADACFPYRLSVSTARTVQAGKRFKIVIKVSSMGVIKVRGRATVTIEGPRRFSWTRKTKVVRRPTTVRGPRLHRTGAYRVTVLFEPDDGGPAQKGSRKVRVKSPERV